MKSFFIFIITIISILGIGFIVGSAYAQTAEGKTATPAEWLQLSGVGYYRFIGEEKIEIELNQAITNFGKVVDPSSFAKQQKEVTDFVVKLIQALVKTDAYAGYIASHRRLVLIRYRSEDWKTLIKEIQKLTKEIK